MAASLPKVPVATSQNLLLLACFTASRAKRTFPKDIPLRIGNVDANDVRCVLIVRFQYVTGRGRRLDAIFVVGRSSATFAPFLFSMSPPTTAHLLFGMATPFSVPSNSDGLLRSVRRCVHFSTDYFPTSLIPIQAPSVRCNSSPSSSFFFSSFSSNYSSIPLSNGWDTPFNRRRPCNLRCLSFLVTQRHYHVRAGDAGFLPGWFNTLQSFLLSNRLLGLKNR